jgi:hypothetical protein
MFNPPPRALERNLSALSIDTTSFGDVWSACPSPTPSTPSSYSSCESPSSQDAFAAIAALDQFDLDLGPHSNPELQLYSNDVSPYDAPSPDLSSGFEYPQFSKDHFSFYEPTKQTLAHPDVDFAAFLASLPSYNSM